MYVFFSVSKDYIHGKYIRINWRAGVSTSNWINTVRVFDGEYDRRSNTEFPMGVSDYFPGSVHILRKGNGLLQVGIRRTGSFGPLTDEFLVDSSGAMQEIVTIFIESKDPWVEYTGRLQIEMLEINTDMGGSGTQWSMPLDPIHMERTGSVENLLSTT